MKYIDRKIDEYGKKLSSAIKENADDLGDLAIGVGVAIVGTSLAFLILNKALPSRVNTHIYIHIR